MSELLAKSRHGNREISLLQHTRDVMDMAETLFGTPDQSTRLGFAWRRFFKVPEVAWPSFHANLLASAAFHDWGKANDGFQAMVHRREGEQVIWHEHLSALMLGHETVLPWLKPRQDIDWDVVLSAVLTHHLRGGPKDLQDSAPPLGRSSRLRLDGRNPEFTEILRTIFKRLKLDNTLPMLPEVWSFKPAGSAASIVKQRADLRDKRLRRLQEALRRPDAEPRRRMLWAVRSALIASDAAASGLPRVGENMVEWIKANFDDAPRCDKDFIDSKIIDRRIEELRGTGKWNDWTDFQKRCDTLADRALLLAPCGSGKTLAAWRWIAARLKDRSVGRVIFLYPTRATAKEGFRDYVSWAPGADATLMHGTAGYDLQGMFTNEQDPRFGNLYETDRRLYALGFWTRRVFSATVDQFLAFLQYAYGPVCLLPLLADSVVVIDEAHSFDRSMFSALKDFLKTFDVPTLCMTATLPKDRREALAGCGLEVCDEKPGELRDIAEASRYRLRSVTEGEVPERIRKALAEGKRVLWVVNQVKRAQRAARRLACDFSPRNQYQQRLNVLPGIPLFCYHSRFLLMDRVKRHNEVVEAFRSDSPPALAISTQVCEMSLDMDADLLVTETCPATALIQRMGRCNRNREPRTGAGEVLIYQPADDNGNADLAPYRPDSLTGVDAFVSELSAREWLNQVDLEEALGRVPLPPARGDKASNFLESGPYAVGGEEDFRDVEEFSVRAVLRRDVEGFLHLQEAGQPSDGLIVPVPRRLGARDERLPSFLAVAETGHYHAAIGFCDDPLRAEGGTD